LAEHAKKLGELAERLWCALGILNEVEQEFLNLFFPDEDESPTAADAVSADDA
jgi:hypothetical protein